MSYAIGIAGLAGAGKDTFALALQRALFARGVACSIDSFAAPIRRIAELCHFRLDRANKERVVWYETERLTELLFDAFRKVLAPALRDGLVAAMYGRMLEALEGYADGDATAVSPRQFMQQLGTECGRAANPQLWVELLGKRAGDGPVIVPDVRFDNELPAVDLLVNVIRPGLCPSDHASDRFAAALLHPSWPVAVGGVPTQHIRNTADIAALEREADALAQQIVARRDISPAA